MTAFENSENAVTTGNSGAPFVLPQACLFGANGSGKSGLIMSMDTVFMIIRDSFKDEQSLKNNYDPHLFHSKWRNEPTEFEVTFLHDDSLFQYGFNYNAERVLEEWLFERPSSTGRQRQIFTREYKGGEKYDWDIIEANLEGERESWKAQTRHNALFLSTAIHLNAKPLKRPFNWLIRGLRTISDIGYIGQYTASRFDEDAWKGRVIEFLSDIDLQLEAVDVIEKNYFETDSFLKLPTEEQDQFKSILPKHKVFDIYTYRKDDEGIKQLLDFKDESRGTREFFRLIGPILNTLDNGYTLVVDELNTHLHPLAFRYIIRMFCSPKSNKNNAQLIFTTHDPTVTEEDCIGHDQIWLVDKGDDLASRLIPLSDYKTDDERPFRKGYLQGRYGAVPRLAG
ncbi:MAG: ATP-binding protein [Paracoccaceae bacterium]|nr:ATP-binding protein [Paracoccaceae bacterium]MDE2916941.1 ATP-binding protein [Paracoccaceae bacterium]